MVSQHDEVLRGEVEEPHQHCLSSQQLLNVYGLAQSDTLEPVSFLHLCPAIIYQLDLGSCFAAQRRLHLEISDDGSPTQSSKLMSYPLV